MTDAYLYGHVSTGVIVRLEERYPEPNGYAEIAEMLDNHCGEAAGSAIVLARLGVSVVLEGNWIGDTPACRGTLAFLESRGIDCSGLVVKPGYPGVNEITISDGESRTVFGRYLDLLFTTPQWEAPNLSRIDEARIVCVDPSFGDTTLAVARAARDAGKQFVTSDARHDSELASLADAIAVSGELMARDYPEALRSEEVREELFAEYLKRCPGLVIFTAGSRPLWYGRGRSRGPTPGTARSGEHCEMAPFSVEIVDSAGAGDSFRGGLVYGMLRGWSDEATVRFASAVAALVCTTTPGCIHPPALEQVKAFLEQHGAAVPSA